MASLKNLQNENFCGGAIIGSDFVITSAICVQSKNVNDFKVTARTTYESETAFLPIEIVNHHSLGKVKPEELIALIRVEGKFTDASSVFKPVALIPKEKEALAEGDQLIMSGYGKTSDVSESVLLVYLYSTVTSKAKCLEVYKTSQEGIICSIGNNNNSGACDGDEGGPLVTDNFELAGIISEVGCGSKADKSIQVAYFRDWIVDTVNSSRTLEIIESNDV